VHRPQKKVGSIIRGYVEIREVFVMPIYEYKCTQCGEKFEKLQKMSDRPTSKCPKCKGEAKRLISSTSFSLKGEGWYKDGYSSGKAPKSEECKSCAHSAGCPHSSKGKK
jgi:putative FmdB family regulatory protein